MLLFIVVEIISKLISFTQIITINLALYPLYLSDNFINLFFGIELDVHKYTKERITSYSNIIINFFSPKHIFNNFMYLIK